MAKKRISRARKKKLNEPDEFITFSAKMLNFVAENKNQATFISVAVLLIIIMFIGIRGYFIKSENRAFTVMSRCMSEYRASEYQAAGRDNKNNSTLQEVDDNLNGILDKYSVMNAKKFAKVYLANMSFQNKDFEKAIELYTDAVNDFSNDPSIKNLILNSLACSYEDKNDHKSAVSYFEMVVSGNEIFMKDEALFNLGRLYAMMGEHDKSRDAFVDLKDNYPNSLHIEFVKEKKL
ncbi:MAG: tetratricopeptide repeat protein [Desulfosarcina sp.]|nr:tetratricopeptide repeat protein [Desulfobacterales bacterium]